MSKRSSDLVKYVKFLVDAGAVERPVWLSAVERVPPAKPTPGRRPPTIQYPEDRLLDAYYAKHPEAKLEPMDAGSFDPPPARRFVHRQMELMEGGMERKAAFAEVERELAEQGAAGPSGSVMDAVQREEESSLQRALAEYMSRHPAAEQQARHPRRRRPSTGSLAADALSRRGAAGRGGSAPSG